MREIRGFMFLQNRKAASLIKSEITGFTLVELLVVISILAVLSTIGVTIFRNAGKGAGDSVKKGKIDAIAKAYELGYNGDAGTYRQIADADFSSGRKPDLSDVTFSTGPDATPPDNTKFNICATLSDATQYCRASALELLPTSTPAPTPTTGPPPTPTPALPMGGLLAWYKADVGTNTTTNGVAVTTWSDQSGNGRDLTGTGHAPLYRTNSINGKPSISFTSANLQYMNTAAFSIPQPATVFLVGRGTNPSQNVFLDGSTHNQMLLYHISGTQLSIYAGGAGISSAALTAAEYHILDGVFNGASSKLSMNGVVTTGSVSASTASGLYVGHYGSDTAVYLDGEITEILVYSVALSDTQRRQVEAYLSAKYNIPVI